MSIFSGSTEITAANGIYSGAVPVQAVYSGATRVWVKEIISSLSSALSHTNSLTDTWDNPTRAYDGDLNTYASFSTGFGSTVDAGLDLTFPSISASEIVEVRLFVKGRGSSGVARNTTVAALSSGVGAHAAPQASTILIFPDGGFVTTYDSGLVATDQAGSDSNKTWNFDASLFIGSSAAVLNWWANSPRLRCITSDFNFGGSGGLMYEVQLQVKYKPA
jgi:hypothetical protein